MIIAIDGPAGSGKSTIAKLLAEKLGLVYLDTGAIFRTMALLAERAGFNPEDDLREDVLIPLIQDVDITFRCLQREHRVFLDHEDVSQAIRTPKISRFSSKISILPAIRERALQIERKILARGDAVLEGRDTTTVVCPEADFKFFLTASVHVRGTRRFQEMQEKGYAITLEDTIKEVIERDQKDSTRAHAPLQKAADAIEIDTSHFSISDILDRMLYIVQKII